MSTKYPNATEVSCGNPPPATASMHEAVTIGPRVAPPAPLTPPAESNPVAASMHAALSVIRDQLATNRQTEGELAELHSNLRAVIRTQEIALGTHKPRRRTPESFDPAHGNGAPANGDAAPAAASPNRR